MAAFDFKKDRKDLYQPPTSPGIVDVPEMLFLMIDGAGDPNTGVAFREAMELLYGLAYTIRMNKSETGYTEFVVPPAEGFWEFQNPKHFVETGEMPSKDEFLWTLVLRMPTFVTQDVLHRAKDKLRTKKPQLNPDKVRLERFTEGLCVQMMHLGPYADEPRSVQAMERYQEQRGFMLDHASGRRHHEIYLSDPRKAQPEKMKTVLRLPIQKR